MKICDITLDLRTEVAYMQQMLKAHYLVSSLCHPVSASQLPCHSRKNQIKGKVCRMVSFDPQSSRLLVPCFMLFVARNGEFPCGLLLITSSAKVMRAVHLSVSNGDNNQER